MAEKPPARGGPLHFFANSAKSARLRKKPFRSKPRLRQKARRAANLKFAGTRHRANADSARPPARGKTLRDLTFAANRACAGMKAGKSGLIFAPRNKLPKKQKCKKGAGERKLGCKPDSVVPEGTGLHLSAPLERGPREGCDIPNAFERAVPHPMLSCTGLGFQCPRRLLPRRWALTPPFHPCRSRGGLFSAALSVRAPCGARPALSDGIPLCGVRTFLPRTSRGRMPAQNSQRTPVFCIGGFGISESPARFSPKLKGC